MVVMDHPVLAEWLQLFGMLSLSGAAVFVGRSSSASPSAPSAAARARPLISEDTPMDPKTNEADASSPLWISLLLDWLSSHPRQAPRLG
ncbi:MAG: hypothetical protein DI601_24600 [Azospirillum brasilense]|nr:MAG: hypothetical protein DI601_24600 [Azospirillum brasilense]